MLSVPLDDPNMKSWSIQPDQFELPEVPQDLEEDPGPVRAVGELAEVGEGLLGAAGDALHLGELVAEGDEQLAVPLALVRRQDHDAGHVVACEARKTISDYFECTNGKQ